MLKKVEILERPIFLMNQCLYKSKLSGLKSSVWASLLVLKVLKMGVDGVVCVKKLFLVVKLLLKTIIAAGLICVIYLI